MSSVRLFGATSVTSAGDVTVVPDARYGQQTYRLRAASTACRRPPELDLDCRGGL